MNVAKDDDKVQNRNNCPSTAQTASENDITSEFQECLNKADDLSRRIRALTPNSVKNESANETNNRNSSRRLSRRQSVMIRRIFEKYSDIIGKFGIKISRVFVSND